MKGNFTDHADCCAHYQWWRDMFSFGRKPFALPGTGRRYAPDVLFTVHHMKLAAKIDPEKATFSAVCSTTIEPLGETISEVFFQSEGLLVDSVSITGTAKSLKFESSERGFKVQLPKPVKRKEKVELVVSYRLNKPRAGIYFTGPTPLYPGKPYQVWTQGEAEDGHFWYPVAGADYPNHKMTTEVIATVPSKYSALSNGALIEETQDSGADTRTFHWLLDGKHTSYLVTLVVGQFEKLEESYNGMPVQIFVDKSLLEEAKIYFPGTAALVAHLSKLYGVEYPWSGKYAQVMVQDFMFGGMENTTMTTMTDRILADARAADEYKVAAVRLNIHELKHDWFGDLITCHSWMHAWLNEGNATYGEVEGMEFVFGKDERDYYVKGLADQYFAEDGRYRRPIVTNVYKEPMDMFDSTTYKKGGLVNHMLRYVLGDEGYYRSMNTFLIDHAHQSVETLDLIKSIEKTTGRNMREFFDQWVFGAGFPEYKVTYSWDSKSKVATVKVSQTQKLEDGTGLFSMPVRFNFISSDGKTSRDFTVPVVDKESSFNFALDFKPGIFSFDPENWILKVVDLNVPKGMLVRQLHKHPEVMARVAAAQALGKLGGSDAVAALAKSLKSDSYWGVSAEAAKGLSAIGTPEALAALKRTVGSKHPKVRRAVVSALGSFKDDSVVSLLADVLSKPNTESYFVMAEAAESLGKTKNRKAFEVLQQALSIDSWNEVVRAGVLNGLATLDDERGVDLAADYAAVGKPIYCRPAAILALGKLAKKAPRALNVLHEMAESPDTEQFTLRMSVIGALAEAKSPESRMVLSKLKKSAVDSRIKRALDLALHDLDSTKGGAQQNEEMRSDVDQLKSKFQALEDRLDKQEKAKRRRNKSRR